MGTIKTGMRLAFCLLATLLLACGGGGGSGDDPGNASILVTAVFDPYTRTVPGYADYLEVTLAAPEGVALPPGLPSQIQLDRDDTSYSFPDLIVTANEYVLTMRAYTSGALVGIATESVTVSGGNTTEVDVSANLQTTIDEIRLTGSRFLTADPVLFRATAYDIFNQVLFFGTGFSWGAEDPGIVEVDSEGRARGLTRGYTNVVAWVNNPVITGTQLVSSLGYIPTHIVMSGVGGATAAGVRDIEGDWYYTYSEAGSATDIAIDDLERIYMIIGNKLVRIDDLSGHGRVELNLSFVPTSMDVDQSERIYLLDYVNRRIARIDDMSGSNIAFYGSLGGGVGQFFEPNSVSIGRDGAIYVTDLWLNRIARFENMTGLNWRTFGNTGSDVGEFFEPMDADADINGNIYIMDTGNHRIVRINSINGEGWVTYGSLGGGVREFQDETRLSVNESGLMFVVDRINGRLVRIGSIFGGSWDEYPLSSIGSGAVDVPDN